MITVKIIEAACKDDINLKNEPFKLFGRLHPSYKNGKWSYAVEGFDTADITEMCFPDENYNYDELSGNSVFIGAYKNGECVGLAILRQAFF